MFNFFRTTPTPAPTPAPANTTQPPVKFENLIGDDGTLHGMTGKFSTSAFLSDKNCTEYMTAIGNYEKSGKRINLVTGSAGIRDYNQCLTKLGRVVTFDTSLTTDKRRNPESKTLTLNGCKAVKKNIDEQNDHFKYEIFSPAATTAPPAGGTPGETLVGTFTQLPISKLVEMAGQTTYFSFDSFYNTDERKPYFMDYLSCLQHVKTEFGPNQETKSSQIPKFKPLSILRQFGKSEQCKILLVAGNIGIQIQDPANNGAIFVLPSQFNGAEYRSPTNAIEDLNDYKSDPTGGPLGQLSCHPAVATFILKYAARKLPDVTSDVTSNFTSDFLVINAIDNLIECLQYLNIVSLTLNNGYLEVPQNLQNGQVLDLTDSQNPPQNATNIFDCFCGKLKVLQTDDVPANGLTPPIVYSSFNSQAKSKVSLVYASAVPLNYYSTPPTNPEKSTLQYCVAGFDLVAQYFGAMVSAYNKSKKPEQVPGKKVKLFLTPLGGGVFNNPREMIACSALLAYYQAQKLFTDFDASVEVIFLVWDGSEAECKDFIEFFNEDGSVTIAIQELQRKADEERKKTTAAIKEMDEERRAKKTPQAQGGVYPPNADANTLRDNLTQFNPADDAIGVDKKINEEHVNLPKILRKEPEATDPAQSEGDGYTPDPDSELGGGSKSRRKPVRKTRRGRGRTRKSKAKAKSKTHRRKRHSRIRKHKKNTYTRRR
jgi:hypothetical protein